MTAGPTAAPSDAAALQAKFDDLVTRTTPLLQESKHIFRITSPTAIHDGPLSVTRADILRASARRDDVRRELELLQAEIEETALELARLREAERARHRAQITARKRPLVAALDKALADVAVKNA